MRPTHAVYLLVTVVVCEICSCIVYLLLIVVSKNTSHIPITIYSLLYLKPVVRSFYFCRYGTVMFRNDIFMIIST